MIDLSPQPQDKGNGAKAASATPQHDPVLHDAAEKESGRSWRRFPQEDMEAAIQLLSRWAGPFALIATLVLLGWWIIH
ncbi:MULTISPECIES: hypothetical protein [Sphingobium]|uniref:hypothetical protein n=1 Tax=Sphingobium TaxID=165695 RepID=UPI00159C3351|nr:hypothetical protein [Sphingobium sp. 15-1]